MDAGLWIACLIMMRDCVRLSCLSYPRLGISNSTWKERFALVIRSNDFNFEICCGRLLHHRQRHTSRRIASNSILPSSNSPLSFPEHEIFCRHHSADRGSGARFCSSVFSACIQYEVVGGHAGRVLRPCPGFERD